VSNAKIEKFEGDAVRTDGRRAPVLQRTNFGAILEEEEGGETIDLGIKLGWRAKQKQILPPVRDKRTRIQGYNSK